MMETIQPPQEADQQEVDDQFTQDLDELMSGFAQLRSDVADLLRSIANVSGSSGVTTVNGVKEGLIGLKYKP
jgi:hypothetical protein